MAEERLETLYGLPAEVRFCTRCVMSNQRPSSYPEFKHTKDRITPTLHIDGEGVCDACRHAEEKERIDWEVREKELWKLCDEHRSSDGSYDCLVPGSGGKDSAFQAHVLKYKFGMHPLTVTWPPIMYTSYGHENWRNWIEVGGFDNISFKPNGKVQKLLTRLSIQNIVHPFQTFILGQKNLGPKIAAKWGIQLIFYGENEAEYGNPVADNTSSLRDKSYYTMQNIDETFLGGVSIRELRDRYEVDLTDLMIYLPPPVDEIERANIEVHYLGYYLKWTPQECYYYATEHTGFKARPHRTEGTYSKYNSIDDKIDDLHYYTTYVKFGLGRATYDASQEIRNKHLTREEGVALVRKFDGEFPQRYLAEVMDHLEMTIDEFVEITDRARSPHLWRREGAEWVLRHTVWDTPAG